MIFQKKLPDPFLDKFHAFGSRFLPLSNFYFSYNFSKHLPYGISPKWEIITPFIWGWVAEMKSSGHWMTAARGDVMEGGEAAGPPSELAPALWGLTLLQLPMAPFPSLASHYVRAFCSRGLWACSEYFRCRTSCFSHRVMWPCQWPTAFQNDIMGFNWERLKKRSDYGVP